MIVLPNSPTTEICPKCSSVIDPEQALGLCPACLLGEVADQIDSPHGAQRCPTINQLNQQIKGFQFVELLGRGGTAWTFLAVQESLSREVAVKVMHRNSNWSDSSARFQREAESLAKLNHPGIVTIHDFGSTEDFHFLIMEFVAGPTLRRRRNAVTPNVKQSLNIATQICNAVQYAHDAGILHRDIKPENILFTSESSEAQVKVADFGIAQIFASGEPESLTQTGWVSGTPYYIAPEQNRGLNRATPRSDVFAIGVVLYELLTDQLPIGRFPPPSHFCHCSRSVDKAVLQALQSRPKKRTVDPKTLAKQIEHRPRFIPWALALIATAIVLSFVSWWFVTTPNDRPPRETIPSKIESPKIESPKIEPPKLTEEAKSKALNSPEEENPFLRNWKPEELE